MILFGTQQHFLYCVCRQKIRFQRKGAIVEITNAAVSVVAVQMKSVPAQEMLCEAVQLIQGTISIAAGNLQKCHPTEGKPYPLPTTEVYKVIYCCIYYAAVLRIFIAQHTQRLDCHSVGKMAVRFLQGFIGRKHQPGFCIYAQRCKFGLYCMPIAAGVAKLVLDLYQSVEQIVQQR